jgi:uncharacterized protein YcfJ
MKMLTTTALGLSGVLLLQGCAGTPMGPTVQVLPGPHKDFAVFQQEDAFCRQVATQQVGGQAEAANNQAIGSTLLGSALGAGLGAAVGGGRGAGIGAAAGGLVGTGMGTSGSQHTQLSIQQQYNNSYSQCMYAKGNQIQQPVVQQRVVVPPTVVYQAPPPAVIYQSPPVVYQAPPAYAPPAYAPPPGAVAPPPGYPPPPPPQ